MTERATNEAAVQAAQEAMGCQRSIYGPWCIAHSHLAAYRAWTDRGCAYAVAVADAVVDASAVIKTALDVECPTCDAAPGQDCRAPRTHSPSATHKGRWTVARAMT